MLRSIVSLAILALFTGCGPTADDGFSRGGERPVEVDPSFGEGNSQFLAYLGASDNTPAPNDRVQLFLVSDGEPPRNPVNEFGYVLCEVEDVSNEYSLVNEGVDVALTADAGEALTDAIIEWDIEEPVVSALRFTASSFMNDGEHMLVNMYGADFRLDMSVIDE